MSEEINEFTFEYFKYHYGCEWDTDEFLGWDEVWICIEQLYGHLQAENKHLREALEATQNALDENTILLQAERGQLIDDIEQALQKDQ